MSGTRLKLDRVYDKYGAPHGRRSNITEPKCEGPFRLQKLKWMDGDYDEGGAYWGGGLGDFIYWAPAHGEHEQQEAYVRAKTREEAKARVLELFPKATFYR